MLEVLVSSRFPPNDVINYVSKHELGQCFGNFHYLSGSYFNAHARKLGISKRITLKLIMLTCGGTIRST